MAQCGCCLAHASAAPFQVLEEKGSPIDAKAQLEADAGLRAQ